MNTRLSTLITSNTILSYSNACVEIAFKLLDLKKEDYKRVVIPSRGAYPFYNGAQSALYYDLHLRKTKFYNDFNVWLLPYTSDFGDADLDISSKAIRKFWSIILADTIRQKQTPYSAYYDLIVKILGKRFSTNTYNSVLHKTHKIDSPEDEKFIFIDTAISGRAISEIIEAFYDCNLTDFYIILIVDENGSKLKKQYREIIEREKYKGKLSQINVLKIFSEDASPILNLGISSVVFPSLMETLIDEIHEFKKENLSGAGLWFIDAIAHLKTTNPDLNGARGTLSAMINAGIRQHVSQKINDFSNLVLHENESMISLLEGFDVFNTNSTQNLFYDRIAFRGGLVEDKIDISPSHVVRVDLQKSIIDAIIKPIKKL